MSSEHRLRPKKSLSQNFLVDKTVASRIAKSLQPREGECVVEIGPGTGALTQFLVRDVAMLKCVELDSRAVEKLEQIFAVELQQNMQIIRGDFLELDLQAISDENQARISVIGNIPYSISSGILFHLFDHASCLRRSVIMMQKEVAQRLVAKPRTKDYGILTLAVQMVCKAQLLFDVKPGSFFPRPGVTSTVVSLDFKNDAMALPLQLKLRALIRAAFGQRRKTLRNALHSISELSYSRQIRDIPSDYLDKRAEELSLDDFQNLLHLLEAPQVV